MNRRDPTSAPASLELFACCAILLLLLAGGATAALLCVDLLSLVARAVAVVPS